MTAEQTEIDPLDRPIWGRDEIARVLNMTPKRCEHLLRGGVLDADKFQNRWVSTPRRLLRQFAGAKPTASPAEVA